MKQKEKIVGAYGHWNTLELEESEAAMDDK